MSDELDRELIELRRLAAEELVPAIPADTSMIEKVRRLQLDLAARDAEVARLQAAIDELVAARNAWAYSDDDCEDERVNIAFSVARSLATKPK